MHFRWSGDGSSGSGSSGAGGTTMSNSMKTRRKSPVSVRKDRDKCSSDGGTLHSIRQEPQSTSHHGSQEDGATHTSVDDDVVSEIK